MVTRSVQVSDESAAALRQLQAATGESEEEILSRAVARGIRTFQERLTPGEAAELPASQEQ